MRARDLVALTLALAGTTCSMHVPAPLVRPPVPAISRLPRPLSARIDALLRRTVDVQHLAGVSLAIGRRDGTILYAAGYGLRNVSGHAAADRDTVYNIASISKQFTSAAILLLAQQHRVALDDPLVRYLPDSPFANSVTLRTLLSQTSGIADFFYLPDYRAGMTAAQIATLAARTPLRFAPGSAYEYSNTNFVLLGLVIEKVASVPYASFLKDRLFGPARMTSSRSGDVPSAGSDDATGYAARAGTFEAVAAMPGDLAFGAGAIDSTAPDLVRWSAALFGGAILDSDETRRVLEPRTELPGSTVRYNFGIRERDVADMRELFHRGRNAGYGGLLATFPRDGLTIALLSNGEQLAPMDLADEIHALLAPGEKKLRSIDDDDAIASDPAIDARAKRCLQDLAAGRVDRATLSPDATVRYSDAAVSEIAATLGAFGPLRSIALTEIDARYYGCTYTYRARFERAIAEYRFGLDREGKVWNLAVDREQ